MSVSPLLVCQIVAMLVLGGFAVSGARRLLTRRREELGRRRDHEMAMIDALERELDFALDLLEEWLASPYDDVHEQAESVGPAMRRARQKCESLRMHAHSGQLASTEGAWQAYGNAERALYEFEQTRRIVEREHVDLAPRRRRRHARRERGERQRVHAGVASRLDNLRNYASTIGEMLVGVPARRASDRASDRAGSGVETPSRAGEAVAEILRSRNIRTAAFPVISETLRRVGFIEDEPVRSDFAVVVAAIERYRAPAPAAGRVGGERAERTEHAERAERTERTEHAERAVSA